MTRDFQPTPQEQMDAAFDNYFALSDVLRNDLLALLETESDSQAWRRNFVRASASLIEGYAHCLRNMCAVGFECMSPAITKEEMEVIRSEHRFGANDRIKLTLRVAYKFFELQGAPNFGGPEWKHAQRVLQKRHLLMHPKKPSDLDMPDSLWEELRDDVAWLLKQLFSFIQALQVKYCG